MSDISIIATTEVQAISSVDDGVIPINTLSDASLIAVTQVTTGLTGQPGEVQAGEVPGVSTDQNNQITLGQDGGLYVSPPQLSSSQW